MARTRSGSEVASIPMELFDSADVAEPNRSVAPTVCATHKRSTAYAQRKRALQYRFGADSRFVQPWMPMPPAAADATWRWHRSAKPTAVAETNAMIAASFFRFFVAELQSYRTACRVPPSADVQARTVMRRCIGYSAAYWRCVVACTLLVLVASYSAATLIIAAHTRRRRRLV